MKSMRTARDLPAEDRRMLSGRVEQIYEKDAWSHEQLVALVHKFATQHDDEQQVLQVRR